MVCKEISRSLQTTSESWCCHLNIIMKTIMMGNIEMVLPDIHMMNRFIGTCLKGPRARSQLRLILRLGSASLV